MVSLLLASLATIVNVAIEVHPLILFDHHYFVAQAQMVAKTAMGENHIGPGFIFIYLGARYFFIVTINKNKFVSFLT